MKFLGKNWLNSKVNNWPVKVKQYHIKFEYIKGNLKGLANTKSRLIEQDPNIYQKLDPEGQEYVYCFLNNYLILLHAKYAMES